MYKKHFVNSIKVFELKNYFTTPCFILQRVVPFVTIVFFDLNILSTCHCIVKNKNFGKFSPNFSYISGVAVIKNKKVFDDEKN
jgi:hypothetical protein